MRSRFLGLTVEVGAAAAASDDTTATVVAAVGAPRLVGVVEDPGIVGSDGIVPCTAGRDTLTLVAWPESKARLARLRSARRSAAL